MPASNTDQPSFARLAHATLAQSKGVSPAMKGANALLSTVVQEALAALKVHASHFAIAGHMDPITEIDESPLNTLTVKRIALQNDLTTIDNELSKLLDMAATPSTHAVEGSLQNVAKSLGNMIKLYGKDTTLLEERNQMLKEENEKLKEENENLKEDLDDVKGYYKGLQMQTFEEPDTGYIPLSGDENFSDQTEKLRRADAVILEQKSKYTTLKAAYDDLKAANYKLVFESTKLVQAERSAKEDALLEIENVLAENARLEERKDAAEKLVLRSDALAAAKDAVRRALDSGTRAAALAEATARRSDEPHSHAVDVYRRSSAVSGRVNKMNATMAVLSAGVATLACLSFILGTMKAMEPEPEPDPTILQMLRQLMPSGSTVSGLVLKSMIEAPAAPGLRSDTATVPPARRRAARTAPVGECAARAR